MGKLAKKLARTQNKHNKFRKQALKEERQCMLAKKQTRHLTTKQIVVDMMVKADAINDVSTILLLAANHVFGFGAKRIKKLNRKMFIHYDCIKDKMVTMRDIDRILKEEAHLDIQDDREDVAEKYKDFDHYFQITRKVMDELSSCWLISLLDGFNYKAKRLAKGYHEAGKISLALKENRTTSEDLFKELEIIKMRGRKTK